MNRTEIYPLHTPDDEHEKDQGDIEDSRKSLFSKKDDTNNLQKDLTRLITENEPTPTPMTTKGKKHFTFNLDKESNHSQILNMPPLSAEIKGRSRFKTPLSVSRRRDKRMTIERLETIYTKRNRFHRDSMFSVDNRNQTMTYLERLLISTEPDSSDSDISEDGIKVKENNVNDTDEEGEEDEDDELNNSAYFPLEGQSLDFKDTEKADQITEYFEVSNDRLKHVI